MRQNSQNLRDYNSPFRNIISKEYREFSKRAEKDAAQKNKKSLIHSHEDAIQKTTKLLGQSQSTIDQKPPKPTKVITLDLNGPVPRQ